MSAGNTGLSNFSERLASDEQMIVLAVSEPVQPRQVLVVGPRRFMVLAQISEQQYREVRDRNRRVRELYRRPHADFQWLAQGETYSSKVVDNPTEAPADCTHFYWVEEI